MNAETKMQAYQRRAAELMLSPAITAAYLALNNSADATGHCPSCGEDVSRYESARVTHARTCKELISDATETRCQACGSAKPAGQSCICFDNGCQ